MLKVSKKAHPPSPRNRTRTRGTTTFAVSGFKARELSCPGTKVYRTGGPAIKFVNVVTKHPDRQAV